MNKIIFKFAIGITILVIGINISYAQTDKPYTEGPLWQVQFVHTKSGMSNLYLKNLSEGWVKQMRAAKEAGLIIDYKVLSAQPASENDWDLMLMYQVKNYAMLDGMQDKIDAMSKKVFNTNEEGMHTKAVSRNELRVLQGGKLTQELQFK